MGSLSPAEIGKKLGKSERTIYRYIEEINKQ
jgi:transcriptional antiterminator